MTTTRTMTEVTEGTRWTGLVVALLVGALLLAPAVVLADSASSRSMPSQYRGPAHETGGGRATSPLDLDGSRPADAPRSPEAWSRWEFWFEHEKDGLLRSALTRMDGGTATGPAIPDRAGTPFTALQPEDLSERILPAIRLALRDPDPRVRMAAALAAGNAGDRASLAALEEMLRDASVAQRRAAALGLGFLGAPQGREALVRAARTDSDGEVRSLALISLGLLGDAQGLDTVRDALLRSLDEVGRESRERAVAAVTALGLHRDREAVPLLQRVLESSTLREDRIRSHAATALGRIGDAAAVPALLRALRGDGDAGVRRSAALALGAFRGPETGAELLRAMSEDGDTLVQGLASVSLARAVGAAAVPPLAARTTVRTARGPRGFAVLALGLTGEPGLAVPVLRPLLDLRSEDSVRGAAAVALGLLGDRTSAARLAQVALDPSSSPDLQGYALLGVALAGDASVPTTLRSVLKGKPSPERLRGAVLATGVRPFPGSASLLLRALLEDRDPFVRGASLLGLGLAPDRGIVPLLADMAGDPGGAAPVHRAAAVTALGQMALQGAPPPVARVAAGINYRDLTGDLVTATRVF